MAIWRHRQIAAVTVNFGNIGRHIACKRLVNVYKFRVHVY